MVKFVFNKTFLIFTPLVLTGLVALVVWLPPQKIFEAQQHVLGTEFGNPLGPVVNDLPKKPLPRLVWQLNLENIEAKSFLVYDVNSGMVLAEKNSSQPVAIASVTKLLTGLVVYEKVPTLKTTTTISSKDLFNIEPVLNFKAGDEIELTDLFYSMMVGSANDAALALANFVEQQTGQSFVTLMNEQAKHLDMQDSHFSNPLGFDSEANYSTASDIRKLIEAAQSKQAFNLVGKANSYEFTSKLGNKYAIRATNRLTQSIEGLYAIKTGFTELANGAMITEYNKDGDNFVIIVLGSNNREADTTNLVTTIQKNYIW